jgi:alpha-glucosidase (family GH31 glycosyl hydrolase)
VDVPVDAPEDVAEDAPEDAPEDAQDAADGGDMQDGGGEDPLPAPDESIAMEDFTVAFEPSKGKFTIRDGAGSVLLESLGISDIEGDSARDFLGGYAAGAYRETDLQVVTAAGAFQFKRLGGAWGRYRVITSVERDPGGRLVMARFGAAGLEEAELRLELDERDNLSVSLRRLGEVSEGKQALTSLGFRCQAGERFYGLGSQSYAAEHRGWRVPIWTREQGIGKPERPIFPVHGEPADAYAPMGWLMSSGGWGLLLGQSQRTTFELCSEREDAWRVEAFAPEVKFTVLRGAPKALLTEVTEYTGRTPAPVPWTFAPWNDGLISPERVLGLARLLRENEVPASVMWVEDWIGGEDEGALGYHLTYTWHPDRERWPDMEGMIEELHAQGFKFLGYFNSFVRQNTRLWEEGVEGGFLIRNPQGEPYTFVDPIFRQASLVDLTNPAALEWLRGYQLEAVRIGLDGWMADFGEWLPFDAVMHDGRSGAEVHNLFPLLWQEANLANLREAKPDGDFTFFARSGFAWTGGGTSGLAPVVWGGDQTTSWDAGDGLRTVIPIGLNLGMSGVGIYTHDIAGYVSATTPTTTKELWFRWVELGAFSPVMRTHHGAKDLANWSLDRDEESLAHWKKYAIEHTLLYPYLMAVAKEATEQGIPMFRHPVLELPGDPEAPGLRDQYFLGDALMVAPVLDEGATEVRVWIPAGVWSSWWDPTQRLEGPAWHTVAAPLGQIPVFVRPGALVPLLSGVPDTFAQATDEGVTTLESLGGALTVVVAPGGGGGRTLADGTTLEIGAEPWGELPAQVWLDDAPLAVCENGVTLPCYDPADKAIYVEGTQAGLRLGEGGPTLTLRALASRVWTVRLAVP